MQSQCLHNPVVGTQDHRLPLHVTASAACLTEAAQLPEGGPALQRVRLVTG